MADLIDRQQAIDAVKNYWKSEVDALHTNPKYADFNEHTEACDSILTHNANICKALDKMPSAQPERKDGKWLRSCNCIFPYECDQCGDTNERATPFCPNCGADMRGGGND